MVNMNDKPKPPNNRLNLQPETLQDLQKCLYDWQVYNFGEQDNERMILGMAEESGELCHAQLKGEQGIRGSNTELEAKMFDSIGDIMVYLLNYLSMIGEEVQSFSPLENVETSDDEKILRKAVLSVYAKVAKIIEEPANMLRIQHLVMSLIYLCALKGWNLEAILRQTWSQVGQRDWKQYPETGMPPGAPQLQAQPHGQAQQPTA